MRVSTSALIRAKSRESPDPRQNKARKGLLWGSVRELERPGGVPPAGERISKHPLET